MLHGFATALVAIVMAFIKRYMAASRKMKRIVAWSATLWRACIGEGGA
jgi:hypothetical protein